MQIGFASEVDLPDMTLNIVDLSQCSSASASVYQLGWFIRPGPVPNAHGARQFGLTN
jgi:hypothetical protein